MIVSSIRFRNSGKKLVCKAAFTASRALFLTPDGQTPAVGSTFRNPELAQTYRLIAKDGPGARWSAGPTMSFQSGRPRRWRVGLWGVAAACAVTLAAFAATSHIGTQRIVLAVNQARGTADPPV